MAYFAQPQYTNSRAPRTPSNNFSLDRLEAAEARDAAAGSAPQPQRAVADYRQQHQLRQQQQQAPPAHLMPEWARVQAEGLSESRIAYGQHTLSGGQGAAGANNQKNIALRTSQSRSQFDFSHPSSANDTPDDRFYRKSAAPAPGGNAFEGLVAFPSSNKAQGASRAAGGRSNLAGPSDAYGGRRFQTGHGVLA